MKKLKILITGGAGFVGSYLADALLREGHTVRVLDNLDPQVHSKRSRPAYLHPQVELLRGDVCKVSDVQRALKSVDVVYHLAAAVGVGQSMYQIRHYVQANTLGAAVLLEEIARLKKKPKRLVVASSMSIYGEGAYTCQQCGSAYPSDRQEIDMKAQKWEPACPQCGRQLSPVPTSESKPLNPTSVYAVTKRDHEELCLSVGKAYGIPTVALRYFNIYGPRQALSNPYTGVGAIFCSRLLNKKPPLVFEDGGQSRDFIHVKDITQANVLALRHPAATGQVFNVGTGRPTSVLELAKILSEALGVKKKPVLINKYRAGDIRHCYANISRISSQLGFRPQVTLKRGIHDLIEWVKTQKAVDRVTIATRELTARGLAR